MVSTITALYDVGAAILGDRFRRKRTLITGCVVLIVGFILMATCMERIQMMFGRVLTGLGIGFIHVCDACVLECAQQREAEGVAGVLPVDHDAVWADAGVLDQLWLLLSLILGSMAVPAGVPGCVCGLRYFREVFLAGYAEVAVEV